MNPFNPGIQSHSTWVTRASSPRIRLVAAFIIVSATALLPRTVQPLYAVPGVVLLLLWPLCRMPLEYGLRRLLIAECFILSLVFLSLLSREARPLILAALLKSNLCVLTMLLLIWTTPFHEVLAELRRLRLPAVLVTTLALMCRYVPVLAEESHRMQRARGARTFSRRRRIVWRNLAEIIAQLFIRSADRAERIYLAMCARGWK